MPEQDRTLGAGQSNVRNANGGKDGDEQSSVVDVEIILDDVDKSSQRT